MVGQVVTQVEAPLVPLTNWQVGSFPNTTLGKYNEVSFPLISLFVSVKMKSYCRKVRTATVVVAGVLSNRLRRNDTFHKFSNGPFG